MPQNSERSDAPRGAEPSEHRGRANRSLLVPFALPYALYVASISLANALGRPGAYALAIATSGLACVLGWRSFLAVRGPRRPLASIAYGLAAGLVGCALWIGLVLPLAPDGSASWPALDFALRCIAAVLLVPLFEEQLMRGYVLRLAVQWERLWRGGHPDALAEALDHASVHEVEPGACTLLAAALSTLLFAAGHAPHEWPAALAFGAGMAGLYALRGDLLVCIVAHAVTNAGLAAFVLTTGHPDVW